MRRVKFKVKEDSEFDTIGAVPNIFRSWSSYRPAEGMGLYHDLIEHGAKEWGTIWQEMRAFGALLYIRNWGKHNVYSNTVEKQAEALAYELPDVFADSSFTFEFPETPQYRLTKKEKDKFDRFFSVFFETAQGSLYDYGQDFEFTDEIKGKIRSYIEYGFYKTRRRYRDLDTWNVYEMRNVLDKVWRKFEKDIDFYLGQEFTLSYDVSNLYAEIRGNDGLYLSS